jgi:hypothetical protein
MWAKIGKVGQAKIAAQDRLTCAAHKSGLPEDCATTSRYVASGRTSLPVLWRDTSGEHGGVNLLLNIGRKVVGIESRASELCETLGIFFFETLFYKNLSS